MRISLKMKSMGSLTVFDKLSREILKLAVMKELESKWEGRLFGEASMTLKSAMHKVTIMTEELLKQSNQRFIITPRRTTSKFWQRCRRQIKPPLLSMLKSLPNIARHHWAKPKQCKIQKQILHRTPHAKTARNLKVDVRVPSTCFSPGC